jgi:hypothetical protein
MRETGRVALEQRILSNYQVNGGAGFLACQLDLPGDTQNGGARKLRQLAAWKGCPHLAAENGVFER